MSAFASLTPALQDELRRQTVALANGLQVVGLMNVQYAIQRDTVLLVVLTTATRKSG